MPVNVIATQPGYYGVFRSMGDAFEIASERHFSKRWMTRAADAAAAKVERAKPPRATADGAAASELREALGVEAELAEARAREAELRAALEAKEAEAADSAGEQPEQDEQPVTRRRRVVAA